MSGVREGNKLSVHTYASTVVAAAFYFDTDRVRHLLGVVIIFGSVVLYVNSTANEIYTMKKRQSYSISIRWQWSAHYVQTYFNLLCSYFNVATGNKERSKLFNLNFLVRRVPLLYCRSRVNSRCWQTKSPTRKD